METEKEFERIKSKYKDLCKTYQGHCELLDDINFLINTLDAMNKRAKMSKQIFTGGYTQEIKFISENKIKRKMEKLYTEMFDANISIELFLQKKSCYCALKELLEEE